MGKYVVMLVLLVASRGVAQDVSSTTERRIAVESAVTLSATAISIGAGLGAGQIALNNCVASPYSLFDSVYGCSYRAGTLAMGVMFSLLPIGLTLGSYLPHRGMEGKGRWYAALAGAVVGIAGGMGIVSIPANMENDEGAPMVIGTVAGALFAASMPILALELSHGRRRRLERARPSRMAPIANALPGGAWVGVAGTL